MIIEEWLFLSSFVSPAVVVCVDKMAAEDEIAERLLSLQSEIRSYTSLILNHISALYSPLESGSIDFKNDPRHILKVPAVLCSPLLTLSVSVSISLYLRFSNLMFLN
jgi:hypothetical protein